jgi:hypothetical protein
MKKLRTTLVAALVLLATAAAGNALLAAPALAASNTMTNHGGSALTSIEIIPQVWSLNPNSANPDYPMATLQAITDQVAQSQYTVGLDQYGFNNAVTVDPIRGSLHDRVNCTPRNPGSHTNSVILAQWLYCDWVNPTGGSYGHLPAPNGHRVYLIFAPEGTTVTDPGNTNGCAERLGYHSYLPYVNGRDGYYIVVPLHCAKDVADVTDVISHELAETITDPNLSGWYNGSNTGGEASDICDSDRVPGYTLDWLTVDAYWSNADGACIAGAAHGLAVSNLSLTAGGSTATATATVENNGSSSITIPELELRGKRATDPSGNAMSPVDFSAATNITIPAGQSYQYTGSVTLSQPGSYTFWMAEGRAIRLHFGGVSINEFSDVPGSNVEAGASCSRSSRIFLHPVGCTVQPMPTL